MTQKKNKNLKFILKTAAFLQIFHYVFVKEKSKFLKINKDNKVKIKI